MYVTWRMDLHTHPDFEKVEKKAGRGIKPRGRSIVSHSTSVCIVTCILTYEPS